MIAELHRVRELAATLDHCADQESRQLRLSLDWAGVHLRTAQRERDDLLRRTDELREELQAMALQRGVVVPHAALLRTQETIERRTQERDELRAALHSARQERNELQETVEEQRIEIARLAQVAAAADARAEEIKRLTQENQQLARALHDRRARIRRERGGHR